ncbi:hypothetical protein PPUJ20066_50580 [Pseudomonas putida]|uniref:DUF3077 domain-containing protein n=1 Tax=Pseudomonas sp. PAGU 2196 TaxID=2793997 RepID=UPI001EDCC371|nr:DUF3077 domain-containing protein [Pseudomonas sp. PAGU 2196]GHS79433.1 hypothetical protein PAGU2196_02670 [Pseudomonas sp. PAGU 2196]GLO59022.1 hypothetical protein PPUJ20066_50580 [Pseudomonas putida]
MPLNSEQKAMDKEFITPGLAKVRVSESIPELMRVLPGIPVSLALEQASIIQDCVRHLTLESALAEQGGGNLMWAAHYLSGMAKALLDDAAQGLQG